MHPSNATVSLAKNTICTVVPSKQTKPDVLPTFCNILGSLLLCIVVKTAANMWISPQ